MDLQRIFASLELVAAAKEERDPDSDYLCAVAQAHASFSQRVMLPMTANNEWRTDRGNALTLLCSK